MAEGKGAPGSAANGALFGGYARGGSEIVLAKVSFGAATDGAGFGVHAPGFHPFMPVGRDGVRQGRQGKLQLGLLHFPGAVHINGGGDGKGKGLGKIIYHKA